MDHPLRAPLEIEFDYTRSLGPVLSQFMTGLKDRRILGARGADGRVHAPPFEYDPVSAEPPGELTEVGPEGTVVSWSWMPDPLAGQGGTPTSAHERPRRGPVAGDGRPGSSP